MWAYEVHARSTGDKKSAREERRGDVVVGQYSAMDPDGSLCVVDYSVAPDTDFQATVTKQSTHENFQSQSQ
ncbi:Cuticle protein 18.6-like 3 [Homarus americanus]|uniref:Cuticle protein 18.6-like 3 n=1 Tax=Homarus americanus TaxID=6706 RepID=A0A8J5JP63_HOMAM|nr:Cuticle protein 18.6-like 3 [Homarus americanus]